MKKNISIVNVPEIQSAIKSKHKAFLKDVGVFSHMVSDNHELIVTRLASRISRILECFIEEDVITEAVPITLSNTDCVRTFRLSKRGFNASVFIFTNGESIIISKNPFAFYINGFDSDSERINAIDVNKFDGFDFSKLLLNYIHKTIYKRKESYESRLSFCEERK